MFAAKMAKIREFFSRPPAFSALLPWIAFEDDLFILDDGSIGLAWKIVPSAVEVKSPEEMDRLYERFETALLILPQDGSVSGQIVTQVSGGTSNDQVLRKYSEAGTKAADNTPGVVRALAAAREKRILQGANGFWPNDYFRTRQTTVLMCLRFAFSVNSLLPSFINRHQTGESVTIKIKKAMERATTLRSSFESALSMAASEFSSSAMALNFSRATDEDLLSFVWPKLNPGLAAAGIGHPPIRREQSLRSHLVCSDVSMKPEGMILDGWETRAISFRMLPAVSWPGMFDLLMGCGQDLVLSTGFEIPDKAKSKTNLNLKRTLSFKQRFTFGGNVSIESEVLGRHLDGALLQLEEGKGAMANMVTCVSILHSDPVKLQEGTDKVCSALAQMEGAAPWVEKHMGPQAYISALPFCHSPFKETFLQREHTMLTSNLIHFFPFTGKWRGTERVKTILHNRGGDIAAFDPNSSSVPHTIVAATSGAGKSFLANRLFTDNIYTNGIVFVLDVGGSYRHLCSLMGGQYMEVGMTKPIVINPFYVHAINDDAIPGMVNVLQQMIRGANNNRSLNFADDVLLEQAVRNAFKAKGWLFDGDGSDSTRGEEVILSDIVSELKLGSHDAQTLAAALYRYHGEGSFSKLLDRPNDIDISKSPFVVFDLQGLKDHPSLQSVLLLCIMQRITAEMEKQGNREISKYIVVDECWSLLQDETAAKYIEYVSRTARKWGGVLFCISQSLLDWKNGPAGEVILQNCPNRLFLKQSIDTLNAMKDILSLTQEELKAISSLQTIKGKYSEVFVSTEAGKGVLRYVPGPEEYWVFTTAPEDIAALDKAREDNGGNVEEAISLCAQTWPYGIAASQRITMTSHR